MKQNMANRLAVGGVWAINIAWQTVEISQRMAEDGIHVPIGNGTPPEIFTHCGLDAFQMFCNAAIMKGSGRTMAHNIRPVRQGAQMYNRHGQKIDSSEWTRLLEDLEYRRVALWRTDTHFVSTCWTGVDTNPCDPPHIFESLVVTRIGDVPNIVMTVKASREQEALTNHHHLCALVRMGKL